MDGAGPFRPAPAVTFQQAPRNTTETDTSALAREQTVTSAERPAEAGTGTRQRGGPTPQFREDQKNRKINEDPGDKVSRQIEIDPETRDVLLKIVDQNTGLVRWQIPAETLMNMRVYAERASQDARRDAVAADRPALRPVDEVA
ncbi:hypothetical protein ACKTEK_09720 [Tepidamorphus sp. 3E244]|uniref:hypothetical protein n=1 Tax=Tepidamorphus sp. 3E244 TaxID=3385498 RepID=UPI0038FCAF11